MVFYFTSRDGNYLMYMGRDKYENEDLIKYGHPEDVWFHVDDLSSAHVYLRLKPHQTLNDIPPDVLLDCTSLVKANSIVGCKQSSVYVIYTRWKNLKKTADMVEGQVSYHRPQNVRRVGPVEKNNAVVNALLKTKVERFGDLFQEQQDRLREIQLEEKARKKEQLRLERVALEQAKKEKEERSYDRIMDKDSMTSNKDVEATADTAAAEAYEDDFF